jgi:hypothetical protein
VLLGHELDQQLESAVFLTLISLDSPAQVMLLSLLCHPAVAAHD